MLVKKKAICTYTEIKFVFDRISTKGDFIALVSPFRKIENLQKKFRNWTYTFYTAIY